MWETVLQFLILIPIIAYFAVQYLFNFWKRKGIPYVKSSNFELAWYHVPFFDYYAKIYNQLSGHKFGGCFTRFKPQIMIRDPELIKQILIKDFHYFHDRGGVSYDENEPITMHIFSAPGAVWKNLRTKLTPTFTSGKMKYMFGLVQECAEELVDVIEKQTETDDVIDVNDFCTRYTVEVISSCAFGLKTNSIRNPDSIFKVMAHKIFVRNISNRIIMWTRAICPAIKRIFGLRFIKKPVAEFFYKLTEDSVNHRRSNNIDRNDFLQLLMKMQDEEKIHELNGQSDKLGMTNEFMTAQCFLFFVAGFDTSSTVLSCALHEVAANPEVLKKLQKEIEVHLKKYNGQVTYEMMKSMPYLHQVVSETMRKYPVLASLSRVCAENYQIPGSETVIEKGTEVIIPVSGLHRDPKYFPNPEIFDPDRFKDDNLTDRYAYLPFGGGSRNCIGSRFGLMSVKLGLIHLLRNYSFSSSSKTPYSLKFVPSKIVTSISGGIFLKCNKK